MAPRSCDQSTSGLWQPWTEARNVRRRPSSRSTARGRDAIKNPDCTPGGGVHDLFRAALRRESPIRGKKEGSTCLTTCYAFTRALCMLASIAGVGGRLFVRVGGRPRRRRRRPTDRVPRPLTASAGGKQHPAQDGAFASDEGFVTFDTPTAKFIPASYATFCRRLISVSGTIATPFSGRAGGGLGPRVQFETHVRGLPCIPPS